MRNFFLKIGEIQGHNIFDIRIHFNDNVKTFEKRRVFNSGKDGVFYFFNRENFCKEL